MKASYWLLFFGLALATELLAVQQQLPGLQYFSKPLLLVFLTLFVWGQVFSDKRAKSWLILALAASWMGDLLLLFDKRSSLFFIAGLLSFLAAHIFYILLFLYIKKQNQQGRKWNVWLIATSLLYVIFLCSLLYPHLGTLKIPVTFYAAALISMFIVSFHAFSLHRNTGARLVILGALLFVVSDSLLAINRFYSPFSLAGILIMLSYGIAQLCIVTGTTSYLHSVNND